MRAQGRGGERLRAERPGTEPVPDRAGHAAVAAAEDG